MTFLTGSGPGAGIGDFLDSWPPRDIHSLAAMTFAVWMYEARRTGWPALAAPVLCAALLALVVVLAEASGYGPARVIRQLAGALELLPPLAAAVAATFAVLQDGCLELQLSLSRPYRLALLARLLVALALTSVVAFGCTTYLSLSGRLPAAGGLGGAQLIWLAPTLWLAAAGALVGAALRSPAAAAGLLAIGWLLEEVKHDSFLETAALRPLFLFATTFAPGASFWLANRLALLGSSLLLVTAWWLLLGRPERLLKGES